MNLNPVEIRTLVHVETKRTGTPVHDEDLEQEIALRAWEAIQRIKYITHPRGLLAKIVRDAVRDRWRRRRSYEDLESIDARFISQRPEFECDIDTRRQLELLHRALSRFRNRSGWYSNFFIFAIIRYGRLQNFRTDHYPR